VAYLDGSETSRKGRIEIVNKFLRTASMSRLLATLAGIAVAIAGGTAIALAATSGGPVPKHEPLAKAISQALTAKPVQGITASINFTNNLIDTSEIQGSDPLLTGGPGQLWASNDGQLRVELYGNNGDPEIVVSHGSWWVYDPTLQTVYEGTLPAGSSATDKSGTGGALPSIGQIQADLNKLAAHLNVGGAIPTDTGGQATYTVKISPKHDAGLLGKLQLAFDAAKGVPLDFAVYARGNPNAVLELAATSVSYGAIQNPQGIFGIPIPSAHVVKIAAPAASASATEAKAAAKHGNRHAEITGVRAVARQLPFTLVAPKTLDGLPRQSVSLLDTGTQHGALVSYGQNLGGIAVIEEPATASSSQALNLSTGSGDGARGLSLPTVQIKRATGQELDTALGTIVRFTRGNVTYTVVGSVTPFAADAAARAL
jgi:outer membrane lipoprotein-sorting protein